MPMSETGPQGDHPLGENQPAEAEVRSSESCTNFASPGGRAFLNAVADFRGPSQFLRRRRRKTEEFQIGRNLLEQHVEADLGRATAFTGGGEEVRHLPRHHHLADEAAFSVALHRVAGAADLHRSARLAEQGDDRHLVRHGDQRAGDVNAQARSGDDTDFGRGRSPYYRIQGDALRALNPSLGALEHGPYYAVRIVPGSLGTFAGLETAPCARVLDEKGNVIPGLFAAGNDMASIFGGNYPSGGITLGPAMTFGYVAARVMAGLPVAGVGDAPANDHSEGTIHDGLRTRHA